jgi:hypothetical protein
MQNQNAHLRDENRILRMEIQRLHASLPTSQHQNLLHPVTSIPSHHSTSNPHESLDILDSKRHEGYVFPGPLATPPSIPLMPTNKPTWFYPGGQL